MGNSSKRGYVTLNRINEAREALKLKSFVSKISFEDTLF